MGKLTLNWLRGAGMEIRLGSFLSLLMVPPESPEAQATDILSEYLTYEHFKEESKS
jgi:hypothetical protein